MSKIKYDKVPELELSTYIEGSKAEREEFYHQLFNGLQYYGFIILKDHPISIDLLDKAYEQCEAVFNLPLDTKMAYSNILGGQRGYTAFGTEHAKGYSAPDLKEFWHVGRDLTSKHRYSGIIKENVWPEELKEFKDTMQRLYASLETTGDIILEALTVSLNLSQDFFKNMTHEGDTKLRLLHYPPIKQGTDPNCVRAAAHEDINLITILVAATQSGLELLDCDGKWLPVETSKNNLIVDAGDMLARITNDVIPATTHRVVNPKGENVSRYSMPYFIHPHHHSILKCIPSCIGENKKYEDIASEDFLMERLHDIGLIKKKS